jgi:hypothetical protein
MSRAEIEKKVEDYLRNSQAITGKGRSLLGSWTPTGIPIDVLGRADHSGVWTGTEMIVWAGVDSTFRDSNTGGRYDPTEDAWVPTSTNNAPLRETLTWRCGLTAK